MVRMIASVDEFKEVFEQNPGAVAVIDAFATWCGPCKRYAPRFAELASYNTRPGLLWLKFDVDQSPDLQAMFGVRSMPSFFVCKDGRQIGDAIKGADERRIIAAVEAASGRPVRLTPPPKPRAATFSGFPCSTPLKVVPVDFTKLQAALKAKSEVVAKSDPSLALEAKDLATIKAAADVLDDVSRYHASKLPEDASRVIFGKLLRWPIAALAPALDLVRKALTHPDGAAMAAKHAGGPPPSASGAATGGAGSGASTAAGAGGKVEVEDVVGVAVRAASSEEASAGLRIVAGRALTNVFSHHASRQLLVGEDAATQARAEQVLTVAVPALLKQSKAAAGAAGTAVLVNFAAAVQGFRWSSGDEHALPEWVEGLGGDVMGVLAVELDSSTKGLEKAAAAAGEGAAEDPAVKDFGLRVQNCMVGIGTLVCAGEPLQVAAMTTGEIGEALSKCSGEVLGSLQGGAIGKTAKDLQSVIDGEQSTVFTPSG